MVSFQIFLLTVDESQLNEGNQQNSWIQNVVSCLFHLVLLKNNSNIDSLFDILNGSRQSIRFDTFDSNLNVGKLLVVSMVFTFWD